MCQEGSNIFTMGNHKEADFPAGKNTRMAYNGKEFEIS
jgi:hypothetical protein